MEWLALALGILAAGGMAFVVAKIYFDRRLAKMKRRLAVLHLVCWHCPELARFAIDVLYSDKKKFRDVKAPPG